MFSPSISAFMPFEALQKAKSRPPAAATVMLPPAPDAGSIFKTQKTGGARSAFAMMG